MVKLLLVVFNSAGLIVETEPNTDSFFATNALSVPANKQVGHIVIGMSNLVKLGTTIEGVNIGIVKKSNNVVESHFITNGKAIVQKNMFPEFITCDNVVVIPINSSWTEEVYFMIGANGAVCSAKPTGDTTPAINGISGMIAVGQTVTLNPNGNWLGKAIILGDIQNISTAFCAVNKNNDGISLGTLQGQNSALFNYMTQAEVTDIKNLFN